MIRRVVATSAVLLLAFVAFQENAMGAGHIANPFGILCLLLAAIVWFKWELVRDAFSSARNESDVPLVRLGANVISGMSVMHKRTSPNAR